MTSVKFKNQFLYLDVLALDYYLDYILAGIGSHLFIYCNKTLLLCKEIFIGERIHKIIHQNDQILIKGGKELSLLTLNKKQNELECKIINKIQCNDWIKDVIFLNNQLFGLVTAHNAFEYWDIKLGKKLESYSCEEKCILYSCKIVGCCLEDVIIFAGTVFGDVFIWSPNSKELQRFSSHNGAVFSIEFEANQQLLATTSDDRSLRIWSVVSCSSLLQPNSWRSAKISLVHTLFGHTARVWSSLILSHHYISIGEDSQLVVWSDEGAMIKSIFLHQDSGIRALKHSKDAILTGGEDGGIDMFSFKRLITPNPPSQVLDLSQSTSTKVCFTKTGFVYTLNGECIVVSDKGEEVIYKNEKFQSYCLLEVSDDLIILGSIQGYLVVVDGKTKRVLIEEQIINGRIYSIHCLHPYLVTCGPKGRVDIWELSKGLRNISTKILPHCKEPWTTCGVVQDGDLVLGDRMGNVYVYNIQNGENAIKSFRKLHSYLGVTDLIHTDDGYLSVGRDGTLREFTNDFSLAKTSKLPMEWPWKIVKHQTDILILGFRGVSFIIWSTNEREILAAHECGGGHRSCDFRLRNNYLEFLYVKDKKAFIADLTLNNVTKIRRGFHGKEINCLQILQKEPMVVVTGSEDTTLRISRIHKFELEPLDVLKTHVSSVRAVCVCSEMFVSVGGKGQIVVWGFDPSTSKCKEIVNYSLRKETKNWKTPTILIDPETRIMCVDAIKTPEDVLIATGCSDCQIRVFSYKEDLNIKFVIPYTHCILKVFFLVVDPIRVLVSMGTDGKVVFWDVSDCGGVEKLGGWSLHQSGVNSYALGVVESGRFMLVTGGDDNLICVVLVEFVGGGVDVRKVWTNCTTHSCQITGIKIIDNYIITTSIDQRITLWKYNWNQNNFQMEFLSQYMTAVPDIQGMEAIQNNNSISVVVHGKGMEIIKINIDSKS